MKLFDVYPLFDLTPVRAEGCHVYDVAGNAYLDLYGGHAVISVGHGHPHFIDRIQDQLHKLPFYSNSVQNPLQQELAQKLGALCGLDDYQLFLCNSGAEANENALKLASFHNGRKGVITFRRGFHGRTSAAVNITHNDKIIAPINRGFPVTRLDWSDMAAVEQAIAGESHCALIVEGIQGIGGIHEPPDDLLRHLRALCYQHNTILILDEIQSGYGRSGDFFAFQRAGITPDLITVAKGMGNGFPIGGVLIHPRFEPRYGLLGTTFGGNHLACAAGLAVLEIMASEDLMANARKVGETLRRACAELPEVREVRGRGLMLGLQFDQPVKPLRQHLLFEENVFTGSSSDPNTLRLLPPLSLPEPEALRFANKLKQATEAVLTG